VQKTTVAGVCVLVANLVIVAYLGYVLWDNHRGRLAAQKAAAAAAGVAAKTP
jgi:hypothetical protein